MPSTGGSDAEQQEPRSGIGALETRPASPFTGRTLGSRPSLAGLYLRVLLTALPGLYETDTAGERQMPGEGLALLGVRAEPRALQRYRELCGFPAGRAMPATYPHVLAFPLTLAMMAAPEFSCSPLGLVHIDERIRIHRPLLADEPLDLYLRSTPLEVHPRGETFAILTEARADGAVVWCEESTLLHRLPGAPGRRGGPGELSECPRGESEAWVLPRSLGRRYARVSGDRNPIHLYGLSARALGFQAPIAHGMWMAARSLAALGAPLAPAFTLHLSVTRPRTLPGRVVFTHSASDWRQRFELRCADRPELVHLQGTLEP